MNYLASLKAIKNVSSMLISLKHYPVSIFTLFILSTFKYQSSFVPSPQWIDRRKKNPVKSSFTVDSYYKQDIREISLLAWTATVREQISPKDKVEYIQASHSVGTFHSYPGLYTAANETNINL